MKIGLIRCQQTEDICPCTTDFLYMREKKGAFSEVAESIEIIGVVSCGGCPGKRAVSRAIEMVRRGADGIALASCITRGNPINFSCPHANIILRAIQKKIGPDIKLYEYTH